MCFILTMFVQQDFILQVAMLEIKFHHLQYYLPCSCSIRIYPYLA